MLNILQKGEKDWSVLCRLDLLHEVYVELSTHSLKELLEECSCICKQPCCNKTTPFHCDIKSAIALLHGFVQEELLTEEELKSYLSSLFND